MLKKLTTLFPEAIATTVPPSVSTEEYYWFKEDDEPLWLGVPQAQITNDQLELLSSLYQLITPESFSYLTGAEKEWYSFLFQEGNLPNIVGDSSIRFIQFQINDLNQNSKEIELAIKEFFIHSLAFIWLDETNGLIVEEKTKTSYNEDEFYSISITLENDFYVKSFFYIGKFRNDTNLLKESFFLEQNLFIGARKLRSKERVFTYEKIFPLIAATNLPIVPNSILTNDIIPVLKEDPELRRTMMVFLEHNSNTSLAAKKLFVHRNTLQYRIDKFTEKTGINLKNVPSAFTVYLACLLSEIND